MKRSLSVVWYGIPLLLLLAVLPVRAGTATGHDKERVLIVHSYHPGYDWSQGVDEALRAGLEGIGDGVRTIYMDTKRHPDPEWIGRAASLVLQEVQRFDPEVIVAVDDNALTALEPLFGRRRPAIVFCGINSVRSFAGLTFNNVTGIFERSYPYQLTGFVKELLPEIRRLALLSDASPTGKAVTRRIQRLAGTGALELELVESVMLDSFAHWRQAIRSLEEMDDLDGYIVPVYHTLRDGQGRVVDPALVMHWTIENVRHPVFGLWPFSVKDGALAAVTVDPAEHGWTAAQMVLEILAGKRPDELPAVTNRDGRVMLNLRTAERLGIEIPYDILETCDTLFE